MKRLGGTIGIVLLLLLGSTANGLVLSSVDGTWGGVVGGDSVNFPTGVSVSYGNGLEDQVRWGESTGYGQSGLGFTGVASGASFAIGDAFEVGRLRHFNMPVAADTSADSANLGVDLTFSDPGGLSQTFNFALQIDETPNDQSDPSDYIYFPGSYAPGVFDIGGTTYTVQLLGFGDTPTSLQSQFNSPEQQTNSILLWGKVTTAPVPAPGAIVLAALGVPLVGWLRRRRAL